jgi:PIN domain nuclease of toxin-antitoxin system
MDRVHRDPFDRLLAATALRRERPIIPADGVPGAGVSRIW